MLICGIDEAGRGPLAGPVSAASVILPDDFPFEILDDSKKLNEKKRNYARMIICEKALAWGIGWASHFEIDGINILKASLLAMKRSFDEMSLKFEFVKNEKIEAIADGLFAPDLPVSCKALIKADAQLPHVMAASILAKTARDRLMEIYSVFYPEYAYEKHKGYPTKAHREALIKYGPSPIQRLSFKIKEI